MDGAIGCHCGQCRRTSGDYTAGALVRRVAAAQQGALDGLAFMVEFDKLYGVLNAVNRMLIAYPPQPGA